MTDLHSDKTVVHHDFLCQTVHPQTVRQTRGQIHSKQRRGHRQVGTDRRLVLVREALVDVLVHDRRLAHSRIAQKLNCTMRMFSSFAKEDR
jgi:hypothetical protein